MTATRRSTLARVLPPLALVAVAVACVVFGLATAPADDPSGVAASQAAALSAPAWVTAVLALLAAAILAIGTPRQLAYRAGGLLGLSASIGAALGGLLNLVGYASSGIWWAADPTAIRRSAAVLALTGIVAVVVVGSEQLRPGWRRSGPAA
jgi:hypothetical protein